MTKRTIQREWCGVFRWGERPFAKLLVLLRPRMYHVSDGLVVLTNAIYILYPVILRLEENDE